MFDKLQFAEKRYDEISEKLTDPDVISDMEQYKKLMKEYKSLTPIVDKYREYCNSRKAFTEAKEMLDNRWPW